MDFNSLRGMVVYKVKESKAVMLLTEFLGFV